MNERVKKLWVEALRSGQYEQGRNGFLREHLPGRDKPQDCCLGVLCELFRQEHPDTSTWVATTDSWMRFVTASDSEAAFLPREVERWAGLDDPNPDLGEYKASEWNDGEVRLDDDVKATFTDIARMVEEHL